MPSFRLRTPLSQRFVRLCGALLLWALFSNTPLAVSAKPPLAPTSKPIIPHPRQIGEEFDTITLLRALQQSLQANLDIARARALLQIAQAQQRTQTLRWLPTLDMDLDGYLRGGHTQGNFRDESNLTSPIYQFSPVAQIHYALDPARLFLTQQATTQRTSAARHHTRQSPRCRITRHRPRLPIPRTTTDPSVFSCAKHRNPPKARTDRRSPPSFRNR